MVRMIDGTGELPGEPQRQEHGPGLSAGDHDGQLIRWMLSLSPEELEQLNEVFRPGATAGERYPPGYFTTLGA